MKFMESLLYTILVVDDDPVIREVVAFNLRIRGYRVYSVSNGFDALEATAELSPDLVVLDVMMPDLDGWEVCKIIKDNDESIKVLMLTARDTERDKMIGRAIMRADAYITKPFDIDELLVAVEQLIG